MILKLRYGNVVIEYTKTRSEYCASEVTWVFVSSESFLYNKASEHTKLREHICIGLRIIKQQVLVNFVLTV